MSRCGSRTLAMSGGSSAMLPGPRWCHCWSTSSWASPRSVRSWNASPANWTPASANPSQFPGRLSSISVMRVLLVEDDDGVASALAELLGQTGATVVRVGHGADALHRMRGCDLVLLDLGLPDMD